MKIRITTVQITSSVNCQGCGFLWSIRHHMTLMEVLNSPAVGYKMSLKSPVTSQFFLQSTMCTARISIGTIICTHDCFYACFFYQCFKSRKVSLLHILFRCYRIKFMPNSFRTGMYREMLGTCRCLHGLPISLQSFYKSHPKATGKVRIFPVSLMSTSPPRIPEDIHIRRPECESFVDIPVIFCRISIVFGSSFHRNGIRHLSYKFCIKGGSHSDCLRKHGCLACPCHTMQSFVPPVISRNSKTRNCRCIISQLAGFFFKRHLRYQSFCFFSRFFSVHVLLLYPFTAPAVKPSTIWLLNIQYTTTVGAIAIIIAANICT